MSDEDGLFLSDCGADGPLRLECDDRAPRGAGRHSFDQPSILVGRNPASNLVLDHPRVARRHAYLQLVEGRLYAIDLDSREGLRWSGVPRASGWVDPRRPVRVGPATIRVVDVEDEGRASPEEPGAGPGPLSSRFASRHHLPGSVLEIRGPGFEPVKWPMDRVVTLVGGSPRCKVRLVEPGATRFACGLVRTPHGVWLVDLLSSRSVAVNGAARRRVRLEDGDLLRVGGQTIRLTYEGPATLPHARVPAVSSRSGDWPAPPGSIESPGWLTNPPPDFAPDAWELIPEMILRQLPGGDVSTSEAGGPFQHALLMLIRLLGEMHRDHLQVVREEMEQIRRLNRDMDTLRSQLGRPGPPEVAVTRSASGPSEGVADPPDSGDSPADRPDPRVIHSVVGGRLAAWEKEWQNRWRKVIDLLVKT